MASRIRFERIFLSLSHTQSSPQSTQRSQRNPFFVSVFSASPVSNLHSYIFLLLLILVAAALRWYRLTAQDIWGDEAFSIWLSQQPLNVVIAGASDTHPPFYPFLLFLWLPLAGSTAFATRTLSVLIGSLAVPLVFVLANRLTPRPRVKWFATILTTISPLMIYYSQETRMYELVAVLALASTYFALRMSEGMHHRSLGMAHSRVPLMYFISTLLAIYTHYSAFFVLVAQNVFALLRWRNQRAALVRWIGWQGLLVAAYVPWIVVQSAFLREKAHARFEEWGWAGIEMIFGKTLLAFSAGLTTDFPVSHLAAILFVIFGLLGVYAIIHRRESQAWLALLYFLVPVTIAYIVNPIMPFFFERYVLVALPGFLILVAFGLDYLDELDHRAQIGMTMALIFFAIFANGNFYFNETYAKGKYGKMMAYVSQNAQPGDVLILNNPLQKPLYQYYAPANVPAYFFPESGASLEEPPVRQQLEMLAKKSSRVWLVMFGNPAEYDPTGYLERWFGANAFKSYFGGYVDARLALYTMPSAQPAIQRSLRYTLGDHIQLIGYDLDRAEAMPGQAILLTLYWKTSAPITQRYTVFAHVIGGVNPATQSPVWAQMDSEPVGGSRPTDTWQVNETLNDRYGLLIPPHTPPGEYLIEVGMYDSATLARLPVFDEQGNRLPDERVILGTVRVVGR